MLCPKNAILIKAACMKMALKVPAIDKSRGMNCCVLFFPTADKCIWRN